MKNQLIMLTAVLAALVSGMYASSKSPRTAQSRTASSAAPVAVQSKTASSSWFDSDSFKSLKDAALDTGKKFGSALASVAADEAARRAKQAANKALGVEEQDEQDDEVIVAPVRKGAKNDKGITKTVAVKNQPATASRGKAERAELKSINNVPVVAQPTTSARGGIKVVKGSRLKSLSNDELYLEQQDLQSQLDELVSSKRKNAQQAAQIQKLQNDLNLIHQEMDIRKLAKNRKDAKRRESRLQIYEEIAHRYNEVARFAEENDTTIEDAIKSVEHMTR